MNRQKFATPSQQNFFLQNVNLCTKTAFEAAIELLEPPSIQSSTEPPRKEESEAPPETLLEEPASDAPKMEPPKEDAATPIVLKKQEEKEAPPPEPVVEQEDDFEAPAPEPAPTVTHDPPKKKKKKKPKKEKEKKPPKDDKCPSPEVQVESDQLESQPRQVKMAEVYTAFKLNYTKEDPPEEDYEKLRKNTQDFFAKRYVQHVIFSVIDFMFALLLRYSV